MGRAWGLWCLVFLGCGDGSGGGPSEADGGQEDAGADAGPAGCAAEGDWGLSFDVLGYPGFDDDVHIAMDASGAPHLSIVGNDDVEHVTLADDTWVGEEIGVRGDVRDAPDIAIDPSGAARLAFRRDAAGGTRNVGLATQGAGGWSFETVDETIASVGPAVDADPAGAIHVVWFDAIGQNLLHSTNAGGAWTRAVVDAVPTVVGLDVVATPDGVVHACWGAQEEVRAGRFESGAWHVEAIEAAAAPASCDASVGPDGALHLVWSSGASFDAVRHATNDGAWTVEDVPLSATAISFSVDVDSGGSLHLLARLADGRIYYRSDATGTWTGEAVARGTDTEHVVPAVGVSDVGIFGCWMVPRDYGFMDLACAQRECR